MDENKRQKKRNCCSLEFNSNEIINENNKYIINLFTYLKLKKHKMKIAVKRCQDQVKYDGAVQLKRIPNSI